jgi:hypothetical protein
LRKKGVKKKGCEKKGCEKEGSYLRHPVFQKIKDTPIILPPAIFFWTCKKITVSATGFETIAAA